MKCKHLFILMAFMLPWLALAEEYRGLDSMEGATLTTDQTPPTKATLVIPGFQTVTVQLEEEEQNVFSGAVKTDKDTGLLVRMEAMSVGYRVYLIPLQKNQNDMFEPTGGTDKALGFVQTNIPLPDLPNYIAPPPKPPERYLGTVTFVNSYAFWPQESVRYGLTLIDRGQLDILSVFPLITADVAWRACPATIRDIGLNRLLEKLRIDCNQLRNLVGNTARANPSVWLSKLMKEKQQASDVIKCTNALGNLKRCQVVMRDFAELAAQVLPIDKVLANLSRY